MSAEALYQRMKAEAESRGLLRARAGRFSNMAPDVAGRNPMRDPRDKRVSRELIESSARLERKQAADHMALSQATSRDPCGFCGTRRDRHGEFGCKRWVAGS